MALFDNLPPEEIVYVSSKKISQELRHSEPEIKKPLDFKKISNIKKAAPELQKYIEDIDNNETEDDDIIIGGSSATSTQVKKFRTPKDLDIITPNLEKETQNIVSILRKKYGINKVVITPKFRVNMGGKEVDVVQIGIGTPQKYVDAVDIKQEVNSGFMSIINKHPKIKIEKIYVEPLDYLIERKAASIKQNYVDEIKQGRIPKPRMRKDIDDFRSMAKSVPDFKKKNLKIYMTAFEKNLLKDIPEEKETKAVKVPKSELDLLGIGGGDPFGTGGFFAPRPTEIEIKKKKLNPLQIQGFKLW